MIPKELQTLYLEECAIESDSWNENDQKNLDQFLSTKSGRKVLGKFQLMWKKPLVVVPMTIPAHDPYAAAAMLANLQGETRAILRCIDRLFEMEPPDVQE